MSKKVIIRVNGKPYETYMDEDDKQRFPEKPLMSFLQDKAGIQNIVDYYESGACSLEELMQLYMDIGYTVCGFDEIFGINSNLPKSKQAKIENPEWGDDVFEYAPFRDVLSFCLCTRDGIGSRYVEFTNDPKKPSKSYMDDSSDVILLMIYNMDDCDKAYEMCKKYDGKEYILSVKVAMRQDA